MVALSSFGSTCSLLLTLFALFFFFHGGAARILRNSFDPSTEIAEVVHRRLQTTSYCIASSSANAAQLQIALDWACGSGSNLGNVDCSAIQQGGSCYDPNNLVSHASYAFDAYYVKQNGASGSCSFNGLATPTSTNPSNGTCVYPSLSGSSTTPSPTSSTSAPPPPFSTSNSTTTFSPTTSTTAGTTTSSSGIGAVVSQHWMGTLCWALAVILLLRSRQ